jgi:hypothetical protein
MIVTNTPAFIKLKNQTIASYAIQYNINQCFNFQKIEQLKSTYQFYYKGMLKKEHVYELMLVDTAFAAVIGKLAQEVLFGKVKTLNDFLLMHQQSSIINGYTDAFYYQFKFEHWLMHLFFPEAGLKLHKKSITKVTSNTRSVYFLKNANGELSYFSIFESKKLFELLIHKMQLRIDLKHSKIENEVLTLILSLEI